MFERAMLPKEADGSLPSCFFLSLLLTLALSLPVCSGFGDLSAPLDSRNHWGSFLGLELGVSLSFYSFLSPSLSFSLCRRVDGQNPALP